MLAFLDVALPRGLESRLYASHALSRWGDRMWAFAASIVVASVSGGVATLPAAYGAIEGMSTFFGGASVGAALRTTPSQRLGVVRKALVAQNVSVALSAVAGVFALLIAEDTVLAGSDASGWLLAVAVGGLMLFGCCAAVAGLASSLAVEKDWAVVICDGNEDRLARMNSTMRRIDLFCKTAAPAITGALMTAGVAWGAAGVAAWNVLSLAVEYRLLELVAGGVAELGGTATSPAPVPEPGGGGGGCSVELTALPKLSDSASETGADAPGTAASAAAASGAEEGLASHRETLAMTPASDDLDAERLRRGEPVAFAAAPDDKAMAPGAALNGRAARDREGGPSGPPGARSSSGSGSGSGSSGGEAAVAVAARPRLTACRVLWLAGQPLRDLAAGWAQYRRLSFVGSAMGLVILYLSLLSFNRVTSSFLLWAGFEPWAIGVAQAVGAVCGLSATCCVPAALARFGVRGTATYSVWVQLAMLLPSLAVVPFAVSVEVASNPGPDADRPPLWAVVCLCLSLAASRAALWTFDLAVTQMLQLWVDPDERTLLNGVQRSLTSLFGVAGLLAAVAVPNPSSFGWLVVGSLGVVAAAGVAHGCFSSDRPAAQFAALATTTAKPTKHEDGPDPERPSAAASA
ncbi:hypothetical protein FNF27_04784 [Cafeteria roenbergensis]|uniref:Solute carrier family 40 member n=1 Tax=Cafeteria roenbergensis TaxID=33653 RepID=A0A5A8EAT4_CAFRO|nr:hypothetical protein FNF27_04784 [Cafeteria roenbergensis]